MNTEELQKLKDSIQKEILELEEELKSIPAHEEMGDDTEGDTSMDEETSETESMVNNLAVRFQLENKLKSLKESLEKIEKGTYPN